MSVAYQVMYRIGFTPWERAAVGGPDRTAAVQLDRLLEREQDGRARPPGRALDLGCGTGTHTRELASRGWDAVGVDNVALALRKARARTTNSPARFVEGDVTRLGELGLGTFDFFLDIGCFHGLRPEEQRATARQVTASANPGATLLVLAFDRLSTPFPHPGILREELTAAYDGWTLVGDEAADTSGMARPMRKAAPRFYRLALA